MGGKWSVTARYYYTPFWEYSNYNLSFVGFIIKGVYCLIKYDVVSLEKH